MGSNGGVRYITPEALLRMRFGEPPWPQWDLAILCFRGEVGGGALVAKLNARPVGPTMLYALEETAERPYVYQANLNGQRLLLVQRCLWGGPQAAILVEELACLGVRMIVGFGVAGSLEESLPKGTQIVGARGRVLDGTTRAYTEAETVEPDAGLLATVGAIAARQGIPLTPVTLSGVDALFRETPDDVRRWRGLGVQAINMETPALYAVAAACGVRAVWLGHVSDTLWLGTQTWDSWQRPLAFTDVTVALTVGLLETLCAPPDLSSAPR
jgi:uridine phosphorylase